MEPMDFDAPQMLNENPQSVLFVCLGNICRSPAAEGILRHMISQEKDLSSMQIASCGLGDWHVGHLPDSRMCEAAELRGVILTSRAQCFKMEFFEQFVLILAADREVLYELHRLAEKTEHKAKIHLMTAFSSCYPQQDVPDPYYKGKGAFDLVLNMLEDSCEGLIQVLKSNR